jgi:hypothetical protein
MSNIDKHGYLDIRLESWESNIRFDEDNGVAVITGLSINALLHGIFLLNGYDTSISNRLLGGVVCWDEILPTTYMCLLYQMSVFEFIARVRLLADDCLIKRLEYTERLVISESHQYVSNLFYGSLIFMHTWLSNFNEYLTDAQIRILRQGIVCIGNQGVRRISGKKDIDLCGDVYRQLEVMVDIVSRERSILVTGTCPRIFMSDRFQSMAHLSIYDQSAYDFIPKQEEYTRQGKFDYIYHPRDFQYHAHRMTIPGIPRYVGCWDEEAAKKLNDTKQSLKVDSKVKVEIFGGSNLFDQSDSEDDEDSSSSRPIPLIAMKKPLIEAPITMGLEAGVDSDIWSYEVKELARQITLIDHALFCSIPLPSMIGTDWTNPRHMMSAIEYKRFSDRFNTLSLWAITSILREDELDGRAKRYSQIVSLAHELFNIGNYHAAIALYTSLKQGCIVRLELTIKRLDKVTKDLLLTLQVTYHTSFTRYCCDSDFYPIREIYLKRKTTLSIGKN